MRRWLLALSIVLLLALPACSAAKSAMPTSVEDQYNGGRGTTGEMAAQAPAAAPMPFPTPGPGFYDGAAQEEGAPPIAGQTTDRMVIRNADMSIVVEDPGTALTRISNMANSMGGFVVTSSLYQIVRNSQEFPEAYITVRVPAGRLDEAIDTIKNLVENPVDDIPKLNISGQDVTEEYTDLEAQLRNLQQTEAQLLEIMEQANRTEDVLMVFNEITRIRGQIEQIQGRMSYYERAAALSSISVMIQAEEAIAPITVAGWSPRGVARDAIQALINAGQWLVSAAIWLVIYFLPVALIIALPAAGVYFLVRRFLRRKPKPAPVEQP
ncbi:MAG TPA: DUF4349 domain-containing protein [Chloroflexi bacterium]|nr:DUF4349 domain-containing protein [Chloroflexota bacterium]